MSIDVKFEEISLALGGITEKGSAIKLPDIRSSYLSNTNAFAYYPELYNEFKDILDNYRALLVRDVEMTCDMIGCIVTYDQEVLTPTSPTPCPAPTPTPIPSSSSNPTPSPTPSSVTNTTSVNWREGLSSSDPVQNVFDASSVGTDDYTIFMSEVDDMATEIINNMVTLMTACDEFNNAIQTFVSSDGFEGLTAEALKNYWGTVHSLAVMGIYTSAQTVLDHISAYWLSYCENSILQTQMICSDGTASWFTAVKYELDSTKTFLREYIDDIEGYQTEIVNAINTCTTNTSGAYDYSGYTPDFAGLSDKVETNIGRIDSINTEVADIESNVISYDKIYINSSVSELNSYINSVISNVTNYNVTNQSDGIPSVLSDSFYNLGVNIATTYGGHGYYLDISNQGMGMAYYHAYQEALEDKRLQTEFEIASDVVTLVLAVYSLVTTWGADAPIAVPIIVSLTDTIAISFAESALLEDAETMVNIYMGDLDTNGTNVLYTYCFEPFGVSRDFYNGTEQVVYFLASTTLPINKLAASQGNYGYNVVRTIVGEGLGELSGTVAYNEAIANGASPLQATLIKLVVSKTSSGAFEHITRPQNVVVSTPTVDGSTDHTVISNYTDGGGTTTFGLDTDSTRVSTIAFTDDYIIDHFDDMTSEEVYELLQTNPELGNIRNYDLITSSNAKDFLYLDINNQGELAVYIRWPEAGGFDVSTVRSVNGYTGTVSISRSGETTGCTFAIDEDGVVATCSQRAIPSTEASPVTSYQGNLNFDQYNAIIDTLTQNSPDDARAILAGDGFNYSSSQIDDIFNQWDGQRSYFTRSETVGTTYSVYQEGRTIDSRYGFVGEAAAWEIGGVSMSGGATQMTSVFNWELLQDLGVISDFNYIVIPFE